MTGFKIGTRTVGDGAPCLIVGEIAQAHEGSVQIAHAMIDAIADAGADAVKMQCHLADEESTPDEPWREAPQWPQDESRQEYWRRMEFSPSQWGMLEFHARARGLAFIVSPFSVEAVAMVRHFVDAWKVASGEVTNDALLLAIKDTGVPALLSTGMSTYGEVRDAVVMLWPDVAVLQCTSEYPCPPDRIGLNLLDRDGLLRHVANGLSDHSGTIWAGLAAVTLGCDVLEVHVKLSPHDQGFDAASSITPEQLRELVTGIRWIERAKAHPVDKDKMAVELEPMRELFLRKHERKALERKP